MQVITIAPTGEVSGLQRKPGQGLDLTHFGRANVCRASEILWDETEQAWFIKVLKGPFAGRDITTDMVDDAGVCRLSAPFVRATYGARKDETGAPVIFFPSYEEAVKVEVAVLDGYRLKSVF